MCLCTAVQFYNDETKAIEYLSEANIVYDEEVKHDVIELLGREAVMSIPCRADLPYLAIHLKDLTKFMSIELKVVDEDNRVRYMHLTNKASIAKVAKDECDLPLKLKPGWNYVNINMDDLLQRAFGRRFRLCKEIVITSNVRISRVYFQDRMYDDVELPKFLKAL